MLITFDICNCIVDAVKIIFQKYLTFQFLIFVNSKYEIFKDKDYRTI